MRSAKLQHIIAIALCLVAVTYSFEANAMGGGKIITFDAPGAGSAAGSFQGTGCFGCTFAISQRGTIVGTFLDANNVYHGFIRTRDGHYQTIDDPAADTTPNSYNGTIAQGINNFGEVMGYYADAAGAAHGFVRSPHGVYESFDVPGGINGSFPVYLNDEGAIVGYSLDANLLFHAFLRRPNGHYDVFVAPNSCTAGIPAGCYGNEVTSVDLFGFTVGNFADNTPNQTQHAFIRTPDGKFITFEAPGAGSGPSQGTGCPGCNLGFNIWGMVAGSYVDALNVLHGFLRYPNGTFETFDAPGADTTPNSYHGTGCFSDCPVGLNDVGAITGSYYDASGVQHGYLRSSDGTLMSFDPVGSISTQPEAINDAGLIVGYYVDSNNVFHGFLRIP